MNFHQMESGVELVEGARRHGEIHSTTDVEVTYSKEEDASNQV